MQDLIIIVGRTASGKDTFADAITTPTRTQILSHTTRPKRAGEGETHIFIDNPDDYPHKVVKTIINGHHYFVLEEDLVTDDIYVVDPIGLYMMLDNDNIPRNYQIFYMDVDTDTRRERYIIRGNTTKEAFEQRNSSEDEQFTTFETLISGEDYRRKYNITILKTQSDIDNAIAKINS